MATRRRRPQSTPLGTSHRPEFARWAGKGAASKNQAKNKLAEWPDGTACSAFLACRIRPETSALGRLQAQREARPVLWCWMAQYTAVVSLRPANSVGPSAPPNSAFGESDSAEWLWRHSPNIKFESAKWNLRPVILILGIIVAELCIALSQVRQRERTSENDFISWRASRSFAFFRSLVGIYPERRLNIFGHHVMAI